MQTLVYNVYENRNLMKFSQNHKKCY